MSVIPKERLLLTTSSDGDVIIAEVKPSHTNNRGEHFVSEDFARINCENGVFTEMTGELNFGGRIFVLTQDLQR